MAVFWVSFQRPFSILAAICLHILELALSRAAMIVQQ